MALSFLAPAIGVASSLAGSNPLDAQRIAENQSLFQAAIMGDQRAEMKLRCRAGERIPTNMGDFGQSPDGSGCGLATSVARNNAAAYVAQLGVRKTAANVSGQVAVQAARASIALDPSQAVAGVQIFVVLLIGIAVFMLARRGR